MALFHMLTEYIFLTQPTVDFSAVLVLLQIALQSVTPVTVIIQAIRRQNPLERFLLALFPLIFFIAFVFMDVFLGGSFLGGGFDEQEALTAYLLHSTVRREIWAVMLLFPITYFVVRRWLKKSFVSLAGDLFVWLMLLFCLGITSMLAWRHSVPALGPFPAEQVVLWYVYAVYGLAAQLLLNTTAILWRLMFSERPMKDDLDTLIYNPDWCRRRIRHILLHGHRVFFCSLLPIVLLLFFLVIPSLWGERAAAGAYVSFAIILFFPTGLLCLTTAFMLCPSLLPVLGRIERWEQRELLYRQFCKEFYDPVHPPKWGGSLEVTPHFILKRTTLNPELYYIPMWQGIQRGRSSNSLLFRDGGRLRLNLLGPGDAALIRGILPRATKEAKHL